MYLDRYRTAPFAICVTVAAVILMTGCASAGSASDTRPVADLQRQSGAIERELATRNEQELRVRVVAVTTRLLKAAGTVDPEEAETIQAEVNAINAQLSSLKIAPLAPSLRFDPAAGRLVW